MSEQASATSLKDRIAEFSMNMAKQAPPAVLETLGTELKKLAESGIAKGVLKVGAKAPDFTLPDARGGSLHLATLLAKGPVVVTFYRGGWCPFCDLQLRSFQEVLGEIRTLGAELVAISPQTPDFAAADIEKKDLTFPVLTDAHNAVARQFGLVFKLADSLQGLQTAFGNPIPKFNGDDSWELPMPGTFVVGRDGAVRLAFADPDWTKRLEPAAILEALRGTRS